MLEPLELVHKVPCTACRPCKDVVKKVRSSRTSPNSCERSLYTLLSLVREVSMRFDLLEPLERVHLAP